METISDYNIREKLNAVNDFPEGYQPNLELKWELLEAGLQHKKVASYFWMKYAALFAIVLTVSFFWITSNRVEPLHTKQAESTSAPLKYSPKPMQAAVPNNASTTQKVVRVSKGNVVTKKIEKPNEIEQYNALQQGDIDSVTPVTESYANFPTKKDSTMLTPEVNNRVTEIDFTAPLPQGTVYTKDTHKPFKIRIGFKQNQNLVQEAQSQKSIFRKRL